jgi:putative inorganic carbon (HCO3(-)) transporter
MLLAISLHFGLEGALQFALYLTMFGAFLASIVWRPSVGIYLLVLSLPLQTVRYHLHSYPLGAQFLDITLLGSIIGLLIRRQAIFLKSPINGILLLLTIFYYLSLWQGIFFINVPLPLFTNDIRFSDWKNYVEMFLVAFVVASVIKDKSQVRILILVMCFSVLLINRTYASLLGGRDISHFSDEVREAGALGYAGVNGFAAFEAMFTSFLLGLYVYQKRLAVKVGMLGLIAMCCYCLLFSFSRGGYIGLLAGFSTVGVLKARHLLIAVLVVLIGWQTLLPAAVQERISMTKEGASSGQSFDASSEERLEIWEDAVNMFKQNPILGTGFDTYQFMGRVGPYTDTHNYYMKVIAETGLIGLTLYSFLLAKLFNVGSTLFRSSTDPFWTAFSVGFLALLASAIVLNFFGDRWTYQQVDGYLWVLLGCAMSGQRAVQDERDRMEANSAVEAVLQTEEAAAV